MILLSSTDSLENLSRTAGKINFFFSPLCRHKALHCRDCHRLRRWFLTVLVTILLPACYGCVSEHGLPEGGGWTQGPCRTGDIVRDIRMLASSITGLDARARIQITVRGKKHPSVNCMLKWSHAPDGERMRVTAFGPFGITVFDALLREKIFFLYIPSHDVVYVADLSLVKGRNDLRSMASQARMVLNPWSALDEHGTRKVLCSALMDFQRLPGDAVCYASFPMAGRRLLSIFHDNSLAPVALDLNTCAVRFSGCLDRSGTNLRCSRYPLHIIIRLKSRDLRIDMKIKEAEFNAVSYDQPAFDSTAFLSMPAVPLAELTGAI